MSTSINPSDLCSHLRNKLFDADGCYHAIWETIQNDTTITAVARARQLHIYRNGKKILVLAGKTSPKIIKEDVLCKLISQPTNQ